MRVAFAIVAAILFCMPVFAQGAKLKSVTNSIGMELIEIPAGKFTMGSPEDEENRQINEVQVSVTLTKSFGLGKYEVTQDQWKSVMGTEPWNVEDFVQADKDCPATRKNSRSGSKCACRAGPSRGACAGCSLSYFIGQRVEKI